MTIGGRWKWNEIRYSVMIFRLNLFRRRSAGYPGLYVPTLGGNSTMIPFYFEYNPHVREIFG